jgi:hypothetical protein
MESYQTLTDKEKLNAMKRKLSREFKEIVSRQKMGNITLRHSKSSIAVMNEYYRGYASCIRELKVYLDKLEGA